MSSTEIVLILFQFAVLCFSLTIHECAHAWTAWRLGDPTAYMLGRVSLDPTKQLTLIGSVIFPLIGMFFGVPLIGWAKPTPVTPRNFSKYKRDNLLVTLAGPGVNLLCAIGALILLLLVKHLLPGGSEMVALTEQIAYRNPDIQFGALPMAFPLLLILYFGMLTNVMLFLFNLVPIPPLDGSKVLLQILPYRAAQMYENVGSYGIILLYFVVLRTGILGFLYRPVIGLFQTLLAVL